MTQNFFSLSLSLFLAILSGPGANAAPSTESTGEFTARASQMYNWSEGRGDERFLALVEDVLATGVLQRQLAPLRDIDAELHSAIEHTMPKVFRLGQFFNTRENDPVNMGFGLYSLKVIAESVLEELNRDEVKVSRIFLEKLIEVMGDDTVQFYVPRAISSIVAKIDHLKFTHRADGAIVISVITANGKGIKNIDTDTFLSEGSASTGFGELIIGNGASVVFQPMSSANQAAFTEFIDSIQINPNPKASRDRFTSSDKKQLHGYVNDFSAGSKAAEPVLLQFKGIKTKPMFLAAVSIPNGLIAPDFGAARELTTAVFLQIKASVSVIGIGIEVKKRAIPLDAYSQEYFEGKKAR